MRDNHGRCVRENRTLEDLARVDRCGLGGAARNRVHVSHVVSSVQVQRDGDNLIVDIGTAEDRLTIVQGLTSRQVEQFIISGETLTLDDVRSRLLLGTDGDDVLRGFDDRDDVLDGKLGSDALEGGKGHEGCV